MTRRAGREPALRIAPLVEARRWTISRHPLRFGREGKRCVMRGNSLALRRLKMLGDPLHLGMLATSIGIGLKLRLLITAIEPREPRRT
nr:hypothetical protein [Sphingobium sp. BS19]